MNLAVGLLTIWQLELIFHVDGDYFLLGCDGLGCLGRCQWLLAHLAVCIVGTWDVDLVGYDGAHIFDDG